MRVFQLLKAKYLSILYSLGSGYFAEKHSPENLAKIKYSDTSRQVVVSPLLDGDVQVEIQDLCLLSEARAISNVHIAGAHSIHLQVRDKVSLLRFLLHNVVKWKSYGIKFHH